MWEDTTYENLKKDKLKVNGTKRTFQNRTDAHVLEGEPLLGSTHAELIHSSSSAEWIFSCVTRSRCTDAEVCLPDRAFPTIPSSIPLIKNISAAVLGRHELALQFSRRRIKAWTFGWRRIRELGSNFRLRKGSSVSSCPPLKAGVRAHPSVVNFGSVSSSGLYLPACRCLRRREDGYLGRASKAAFFISLPGFACAVRKNVEDTFCPDKVHRSTADLWF